MNDLVKRHWTSFLGALLIVCAFVYLFKYTVDQGWITQQMKIGIGLLVGAGLAVGGIRLILSGRRTIGEITSGMGAAVLYTTVSFSGIYFALWDSMIVLLCMTAITVGLSLLAYRENLRILMNLALIGALVSPLVLRPENDQVFTLFLYLLVINIVYFVLSLRKSWTELRVVAFAGTWILYMVYFFHFDPVVTEVWSLPYRYATAAFLFYVLGLVISSWKNNLTFDGLNLYLNVANAVLFGLWSVILLDGLTSVAYPMAFTGVLYLALSYGVYRLMERRTGTPVLTFFLGGVFLLMLAASQAGKGLDIKPLISVYLWTIVAGFLLLAGQARKIDGLKAISLFVWFVVVLYWFVATWSTPRGIWFGVYLPFLNWGAVSWMVLAAFGFYYAAKVKLEALIESGNRALARMVAVVSHLIVGGLLSVQVNGMFDEYGLDETIDRGLTLSVTWGIYALLLFLWGAYSRQRAFRWFGSAVLILVAVKALLLDLAGEDTIFKVIVLLVLGVISLSISYINNKWRNDGGQPPLPPVESGPNSRQVE